MIYVIVSSFLISLLFGTLAMAKLTERFGRINILRWASALATLGEFLILAAGDAWYFLSFLIFFTLFTPAMLLIPLVYLSELTSGHSRSLSLMVLLSCASLGYLPAYFLIFYYFSWRPLVMASMACGFFCFLFSWTLVESPRYLAVIRARYHKARVAFEYIAATNKQAMFEDQLQGEILNEYSETVRKPQAGDISELRDLSVSELRDISEIRDDIGREAIAPFEYLGGAANAVDREDNLDRGLKMSFVDLVKEDFRKPVLVMSALWAVQGSVLYAFLHSGQVYDEQYANIGLNVLVTVVGVTVAGVGEICVRTKRCLAISCLLAGVGAVIQSALVFTKNLDSASYTIGVALIAASQLCLVVYSIELMPTPVRSLGMGVFQFFCTIGMILGYVFNQYSNEGFIAASACLACFPILLRSLPETGRAPLSDFTAWSPL
jgi:MFS family permease